MSVSVVGGGVLAGILALPTGPLWVSEVLALVALVVGVVLLGDVRRSRRRGAVADRAASGLATDVRLRLAGLDPVEHRLLDLDRSIVVVGPTGVRIVVAATSLHDPAVRGLDRRVAEVAAVVDDLEMRVAGLVVVARGPVPTVTPSGVPVVAVDRLDEALATGELRALPTVAESFARLSARLDLGRVLAS